jgi:hypothetical protein
MSSASEKVFTKGAVTRLSGGDMKVSRYIFGSNDVSSNAPPEEMGSEKSDFVVVDIVYLSYSIWKSYHL